jgi:hypothetical protein
MTIPLGRAAARSSHGRPAKALCALRIATAGDSSATTPAVARDILDGLDAQVSRSNRPMQSRERALANYAANTGTTPPRG